VALSPLPQAEVRVHSDDPKLFDSLTVSEHLESSPRHIRVADFADKSARLLGQFEAHEKKGGWPRNCRGNASEK